MGDVERAEVESGQVAARERLRDLWRYVGEGRCPGDHPVGDVVHIGRLARNRTLRVDEPSEARAAPALAATNDGHLDDAIALRLRAS